MRRMKIKLNVAMHGYVKDSVINIIVNQDNMPVDQFWRKRLNDSLIDNCIEIVSFPDNQSRSKTKQKGGKK